MDKRIIIFWGILLYASICCAQMSDSQVIQYFKNGKESGKTDKQLATELSSKGVTREQAERIKRNYDANQGKETNPVNQSVNGQLRERKHNPAQDLTNGSLDVLASEFRDSIANADTLRVFGKNIFRNKNLTFEPNNNIATPDNYKLGPGDEVIINVWGMNEMSLQKVIGPEGDIVVNNIGPIYLNGMTIKEANAYIQNEFSKIISGISNEQAASHIRLTLGQIRSIQVNVMGEVVAPGTYTVSSLASVFHALYLAGGVNDIGSLRNIKLVRNSRCIGEIDIYELILKGETSDDIRLMEGDFIIVPPYESLVHLTGKVKREMFYELKKNETLATLLNYGGGFTGDAFNKSIRVVRQSGREYRIHHVDEMDFPIFSLKDGDAVSVSSILDRFENRVEIRGAVFRDGMYELNGSMNTVKKLIAKADGLKGEAFLNRAQIMRENEDLSIEIIPVDLVGLENGTKPDIPLQRNDVLIISSIHELKDRGILTISGEVNRPDTFTFTANTTLEDLIIRAGGLLESASVVQVDVSRRIKNSYSMDPISDLSQVFTFELKDGFVIDGKPGFILEPYDDVIVRRSPAYQIQRKVTVDGEVVFSGDYTLQKKNERLSDLVRRAKGLTQDAFPEGARLLRKMNDEEKVVREASLRMVTQSHGSDSLLMSAFSVGDTYTVGIELDKALTQPGSDYDIVLREGDKLVIPEFQSTVKISGVVMYPNTVFFKKGKSLKHYVNQAGGYGYRAKKSKAYVVYMNGTVSRISKNDSHAIQPGCEIIIPGKKEKKGLDMATIMSLTSTTASVATMAAAITALTK